MAPLLCDEEQVSLYVFVDGEPKPRRLGVVQLWVFFPDGDTEILTVRVLHMITGCETCYSRVCFDVAPVLRELRLADAYFGQSTATLNVLCGLDFYDRFIKPG